MHIAIVILNWNGQSLLEQFLPSVIQYSKTASIYVADNASTDNSVAFIKRTYPEIHIIQNRENGGYAKGYNTALQYVEADVFCLLNSDVEVTEGWLDPVVQTFKTQKDIAIVQPKLLDFNNKRFFEYAGAAGGYIDKLGYPYCRGRIFNTIEEDKGQYNDVTPIFWASGACFFVRSSVFFELQGFDELFFAHMEEIDLCWRAKNANYNVVYNGLSTVYHVGGATLQNSNPRKTFLNFRNSLFTLIKNANGFVFGLVFVRLILDGIAGVKFLFELKFYHFLALLKAHFSFYWHLPKLLRKRKMQRSRKTYYNIKSIVKGYFVHKKQFYKDY